MYVLLKINEESARNVVVVTELSEMQDYAYWDANFFPGMHKFHHARVPRTHVFFVFLLARFKNPGAERQINTYRSKVL